MDRALDLLGDIAFIVITVSANLFVIAYSSLARWWRNEYGRHLFFFALAESLVLDQGLLTLIFGRNYAGRDLIRVTLYWFLALVMAWRLYLVLREQIKRRTVGVKQMKSMERK